MSTHMTGNAKSSCTHRCATVGDKDDSPLPYLYSTYYFRNYPKPVSWPTANRTCSRVCLFSFFYHQEKETNGDRCRESRPPGCSPYQALPHWCMGPLRGTPNKFKFASHTRLINSRDICPDDPEHSLCNAHVKGRTQHQTGPDASSYILDNGSLELLYTCRFSMVRYKDDGNVHSLHLCTGILDSCYAL